MKSLLTESHPLDPDPLIGDEAIKHALNRIGAEDVPATTGRRNQLRWFVEFCQRPLKSPGEILAAQEEFAALQRFFWREERPRGPQEWEIREFQKDVKRHIEELADQGSTMLGPFRVHVMVMAPEKMLRKKRKKLAGKDRQDSRPHTISAETKPKWRKGLLYYGALLLREFGGSVHRCPLPSCRRLFFKRLNSDYCTPKHQNTHYRQKYPQVTKP